jgi:DNA-binding GntR family transcriptional regulator
MPVSFAKLSTRTLRNQIEDTLREAILRGSLHPGDRLVERRLSEEFGASLTAVREALISLEADGFVTKKTNSSTYVTEYSFQEAEKVFALRRVVEGYAIAEAIRLATSAQIDSIEDRYVAMVDAAGRGDHKLFLQKDYEWHEAIWQLADNEYLLTTLKRLILPVFAFSAIRLRAGSRLDLLTDAHRHRAMLDALRARDLGGAQDALNRATDEWLSILRAWETDRHENH